MSQRFYKPNSRRDMTCEDAIQEAAPRPRWWEHRLSEATRSITKSLVFCKPLSGQFSAWFGSKKYVRPKPTQTRTFGISTRRTSCKEITGACEMKGPRSHVARGWGIKVLIRHPIARKHSDITNNLDLKDPVFQCLEKTCQPLSQLSLGTILESRELRYAGSMQCLC